MLKMKTRSWIWRRPDNSITGRKSKRRRVSFFLFFFSPWKWYFQIHFYDSLTHNGGGGGSGVGWVINKNSDTEAARQASPVEGYRTLAACLCEKVLLYHRLWHLWQISHVKHNQASDWPFFQILVCCNNQSPKQQLEGGDENTRKSFVHWNNAIHSFVKRELWCLSGKVSHILPVHRQCVSELFRVIVNELAR